MKIREYNGKQKTNLKLTGHSLSNSKDYVINESGLIIAPTLPGTKSERYPFVKSSILNRLRSSFTRTQHIVYDLFLPLGYPESVESSYLSYQVYDSLQGLCSYLRGVVSTSAVLSAAGVGNAEVTAISAAVAWALRDGVGMIGGLCFSYVSASHFDSHVKEFRLFADIINDLGLTLDMLAPLVPQGKVLYISAIATVCKVMCGMAAGATKASITAHFALRGNMADLNAKESTQETLVTLIGMTLGIFLAKQMSNLDPQVGRNWIWFVFTTLTFVHVWANYKGVMLLRLKTLNRQRTEEVLQAIIMRHSNYMNDTLETKLIKNRKTCVQLPVFSNHIPSPDEVFESIVESMKKLIFPGNIHLGVNLVDLFSSISGEDTFWLIKEFENDQYILSFDHNENRICVTLKCDATEIHELEAFTHALLLHEFVNKNDELMENSKVLDMRETIKVSHQCIKQIFGRDVQQKEGFNCVNYSTTHLSIETLVEHGWDCQRLYLGFGEYRIDCNVKTD